MEVPHKPDQPTAPARYEVKSARPHWKPALRSVRARARRSGTILLVLVSVAAGFLGGWLGAGSRNEQTAVNSGTTRQVISNESQLLSELVKDVGPSVVSVSVTSQTTTRSIFGYVPAQQQSAGTGIILTTDGLIITNRHVVDSDTTNVSVTLSDGTLLTDVEVVGRTSDSDPLDIAFLKIKDKKGKTLKAAKLGDSSTMQVGDKVLAIGNALGEFQNTVTQGIISGHGRSVQAGDPYSLEAENLQDLFQTDAAINEGNSGGPLINLNGEVIGINTAIAGGDAQNIGFAIPINAVKGVINSVEEKGKLLRPYLGVRYLTLTDDVAGQYNLTTKRGAYIIGTEDASAIVPDSPADKAGLQEKDIITKVNDTKIDENNSLTSALGRYSVGDKVTLTIVRDGKTLSVQATLETAPNS